jgi:uncharacterized LabA/DUF88 family protein
MPAEPSIKRAFAFFDGQNLFHAARYAFGHRHPNFDPQRLAAAVCDARGWRLDRPEWHDFWMRKLAAMGGRGVITRWRPLQMRVERVTLPNGEVAQLRVAQEKGIDVRIAVDVVRYAIEGLYDVGLIFSQDQDLGEVATDIRAIAASQGRWIKLASAYPEPPPGSHGRGIDRTDWIPFSKSFYDRCLDPVDHRRSNTPLDDLETRG